MPRLFSPFPGGQFASGCSSHHRPRNTQPAPLCLVRQGLQAPTADDDAAELQRRLSQFSRLLRAGIDKLDSASPPHLPGAATMCLTERSPRRLSSLPAVFSPPHPSSPTAVPKLPSYKRRSSSVGAMTSLIPLALASDDRRSPSLARRRQRLDSSSPSKPPLGRALPASPAEWKAVLEDVKRIYLADRHQECAARCHELLDLAAQVPQHQQPVEPAYLVYLGLYAASALESQAQARPGGCQPPRPRVRRLALLQQAQAHHRAACLAAEPPSPVSRDSSPLPSLCSSTGSDLSWSPVSSRVASPDPSLGWPDDGPATPEPAPVKPKKHVSFRDPCIRPDSPTLGFDNWLAPRPASPEPILKHSADLPPHDLFAHPSPSSRYHDLLDQLRQDMHVRVAALDVNIASCQAPDPKSLDLKARADRLRASGWRRPRFDAQRYQTLRENALADLAS